MMTARRKIDDARAVRLFERRPEFVRQLKMS
jgi:hypothetical protein